MRTWILRAVLAVASALAVGCASLPQDSIFRPVHLERHLKKICAEFHEFHQDVDTVVFGLDPKGT